MKSLREAVESRRAYFFHLYVWQTTVCKILLREGIHNFTSLLLPLLFVELYVEIIHRLEAAQF